MMPTDLERITIILEENKNKSFVQKIRTGLKAKEA